MTTDVVVHDFQVFNGAGAFEAAQRMATALSKSNLVPKEYQNNLPNCLIALEAACRIKASPLQVMQNLYIVHGKPSWSSQFIIAAINSSGKFSPLRFKLEGEGDKRSCIAYAVEKETGEILESPVVTIEIAKKEGWYNKNGSKWQTMPELMLRYRSATFFGRLYAPEILMGMKAVEEVEDIIDVTPPSAAEKLNEKYLNEKPEVNNHPVNHPENENQDDKPDDSGTPPANPVGEVVAVQEETGNGTSVPSAPPALKEEEPKPETAKKETKTPVIPLQQKQDGSQNWDAFVLFIKQAFKNAKTLPALQAVWTANADKMAWLESDNSQLYESTYNEFANLQVKLEGKKAA